MRVERPYKLPTPPTPLIGRVHEREFVASELRRLEVRLLTLTGTGGVGKTRLALAVAADLTDASPDGVYFVDLAPITDPALVPSAIANAVGVQESARRPLIESLVEHLSSRALLLVLDNMEHVLTAAPVVAGLLGACPGLRVLATSRAALRLSAEHEFAVPPLALPDRDRLPTLDTLAQNEAVSLFVQRARAALPGFEVTPTNAATIAELCARLDGLPLAIELAAARIKLLPPQALLSRLSNRLALLTSGARDRPARQQTLRSAMDWSHSLLEPAEQLLFARLAVFVGGCSLEAVEAIVNPAEDLPLDVLDALAGLVDKSLLRQVEGVEGDPRFEMLETIREYATERLAVSPGADAIRERHAEYFLALAEQAAPQLTGPQQRTWLGRLTWDHDNLRAALGWALEQDRAEEGMRLAAALRRFWQVRGHMTEGQGWLERALARWPDAPASVRHAALDAAGNLAFERGEYERSTQLHTAALELRRALGDRRGEALSLHNLGSAAHYAGNFERAVMLFEQSLALERELGDKRTVALTLNGLGVIARNLGKLDRARTLYEESLSILRDLEDNWAIGLLLNNLARVARDQERWDEAVSLCHESLELFQEVGDRQGVAWVLSNLMVVAQRRDAWMWAARLHGAVETLREAIGTAELSLSPTERDVYATAVAATRAQLGDDAFSSATAAGRTLSPEQVAAWEAGTSSDSEPAAAPPSIPMQPQPVQRPAGPPANPLTRREREVSGLVARGLTDRQIAEALVVTEGTVGVHLNNIFTKLDLHTRAQLAVWAAAQGLLAAHSE